MIKDLKDKYNRVFFGGAESGMSLVELVVSAGLAGIVVITMAHFFKTNLDLEKQHQSKVSAEDELMRITEFLKQDTKYRVKSQDMEWNCSKGKGQAKGKEKNKDKGKGKAKGKFKQKCEGIEVQRYRDNNLKTYTVNYQAVCKKIPLNFKKQLDGIDFNKEGRCLPNIEPCGKGMYPSIQLDVSGDDTANLSGRYRPLNPDLSKLKSLQGNAIFSAVCLSEDDDQVVAEVDFGYMTANGKIRTLSRKVLVTQDQSSAFQILPEK